eukprot:6212663-Pleurochrysis_carterae.AAC.1
MSTTALGKQKRMRVIDNDSDTADAIPPVPPSKKQKQSEAADKATNNSDVSENSSSVKLAASSKAASSLAASTPPAGKLAATTGLESKKHEEEDVLLFDLDSAPSKPDVNKFRPMGYIERTADSINKLEVKLCQTINPKTEAPGKWKSLNINPPKSIGNDKLAEYLKPRLLFELKKCAGSATSKGLLLGSYIAQYNALPVLTAKHRFNGLFNGYVCTIVSRAHAEVVYNMLMELDCKKDEKFGDLDLAYFDTPTAVVVLSLSQDGSVAFATGDVYLIQDWLDKFGFVRGKRPGITSYEFHLDNNIGMKSLRCAWL